MARVCPRRANTAITDTGCEVLRQVRWNWVCEFWGRSGSRAVPLSGNLPVQEAEGCCPSLHEWNLRSEGDSMNELVDYVCERRPLLAMLVGRAQVADVVASAVEYWPSEALSISSGDSGLERATLADLRRGIIREKRYGNPVLILWGISLIINLIWQWWLSRRENKTKMNEWRTAMEAGS